MGPASPSNSIENFNGELEGKSRKVGLWEFGATIIVMEIYGFRFLVGQVQM